MKVKHKFDSIMCIKCYFVTEMRSSYQKHDQSCDFIILRYDQGPSIHLYIDFTQKPVKRWKWKRYDGTWIGIFRFLRRKDMTDKLGLMQCRVLVSHIIYMPSSHHWHGQDTTVLYCWWCEQNWRQVKTVFSSPQYIGDWTVFKLVVGF